MDPRTFLPPPPLAVAPPPQTGEPAPVLPTDLGARPAVVAFLRHTGCPFAEATLRQMREQSAGQPGICWVAVSHAPESATERWCSSIGGGPDEIRILIDEDRSLYAAWGLGRSNLAHFAGWQSLREVGRLALTGIRNRHPAGTRWQTAGTFGIDAQGVLRWRHIPRHAGELPDLEAAAAAVSAGSSS